MAINIRIPSLNILCASQGSGKSHCIRYIFYTMRKKFDWGIVITNTYFDNEYDFIPQKYIHPTFNEHIIKNLLNIQKQTDCKRNAFLILDDCVFDPKMWTSSTMKRLMTQLRHYNITVFCATQYCNVIPILYRSNAFTCFIFCSDTMQSTRALYESYGQSFESFNAFKNYVQKHTGDYKFIFHDRRKNGSIEDKFPVMKCPENIPEFKIKFNKKS